MHNHNHKGFWGKLMMLLCIGGPIAGILVLTLNRSGIISFGGGSLAYLLFLLCPLSHLLMMPMMFGMAKEKNTSGESDSRGSSCH